MILYRLILSLLLWPWLALRLLWRLWTGRGDRALDERWLLDRPEPAPARRIWVHAASNGELTSARGALRSLLDRASDLRLLVTCNTSTGRDLVAGWGDPRIEARLAPVDLRPVLNRFLDLWRPSALVIVENELWPERLVTSAAHGLPVFVIGARMSARSHRFWSRLPGLARRLMKSITWLAPQDEDSRTRFTDLGLAPDRIGPAMVLKSAAAASDAAPLPFPRAHTILAASTHEGEEEIVLDAFAAARADLPDLHLVLAPRHPRRRDEVEAAIRKHGLAFATRSRGADPEAGTPVYLADTLGEMDRWYAGAGVTFVGGSLIDRGGHTPFEPAAHGSAILTGPHVSNAAPAYAALIAAGGATEVRDAASLATAIRALADPALQAKQTGAARAALAGFGASDAIDAFLAALADATGIAALAQTPEGPDHAVHA
ncbi:3-deoxy-D-manno-octulosonic acid transferase [Defluviimonas sp. SAOS-178_SWC]|uniref:3-deoxy-D-manno-octulosonic acid transferase n=1 Tax=Defluviimonas sp. SAOS-178_SWC TaxID=3121287 RepID=UPI003221CEC7